MIHRWLLRVTAVVLTLSVALLVVGGAVYFRNARERHRSLREWNEARCAVFRRAAPGAADPCAREAPMASSRGGDLRTDDVAGARRALLRGDDDDAARRLAAILRRSRDIERRSSAVSTTVAADLVDGVLDVLDEAPRIEARSEVRRALAETELRTAARPLETERLQRLSRDLAGANPLALLTWGLADARIAERAERRDAILRAMERAARQGDLAGCQRAALSGNDDHGVATVLCAKAVKVARTSRRLARARAGAR